MFGWRDRAAEMGFEPARQRDQPAFVARRADELTADNAIDILHEEVGVVFGHVLDNAGVFKWDEAGRAAQQRFIDSL